jgi:hypothetical protein
LTVWVGLSVRSASCVPSSSFNSDWSRILCHCACVYVRADVRCKYFIRISPL